MSEIAKTGASQPLSPVQQQAMKRLDQAATQLEGVFLQLVMGAMDKTVSHDSIFGKQSNGERVFQSMLNQQRAEEMAKTGSIGIAKILEEQLKASVLADASQEAKVNVKRSTGP